MKLVPANRGAFFESIVSLPTSTPFSSNTSPFVGLSWLYLRRPSGTISCFSHVLCLVRGIDEPFPSPPHHILFFSSLHPLTCIRL